MAAGLPFKARINRALRSLENPTYLAKNWTWLYWRVYKFSWADYYRLFDNQLANASIMVTFVGYVIFLNDFLTEHFGFKFITGNSSSFLGFDILTKLHLLFFGLLFISLSRILYLWRRPNTIRHGPSETDWVNFGMVHFTFKDFFQLYDSIETGQHRTLYGKYYTDDWDAFHEDATWRKSGRSENLDQAQKRESRQHVSYSEAKARHESFLRGVLIDRYAEFSATRKVSLFFAVCLALPGYILFLLPSFDLILTITSTFFGAS